MSISKTSYSADFQKSVSDFGFDPYTSHPVSGIFNDSVINRVSNGPLGKSLSNTGELSNDLYNSLLASPKAVSTQTDAVLSLPADFNPSVLPPNFSASGPNIANGSLQAQNLMKGGASVATTPFRFVGQSFGPGVAFASTMVGQGINAMYESQMSGSVDYANDRFRYGPGNSISKENYLGSVKSDIDTEKSVMNIASLFGPIGLAVGGIVNSSISPGSDANLATSFSTGGGMVDATATHNDTS